MSEPQEIKYEFKVRYKASPHYTGHWHAGLKPGVHGAFDTLADAQKAAEFCKKWFNEEKKVVESPDEHGVIKPNVKTTTHDNVTVWIEEYQNGVLVTKPEKKEKAA